MINIKSDGLTTFPQFRPLAIRDNLLAIFEPCDGSIIFLNPELEDGRLVLHDVLALEVAGEVVLELRHLQLAGGLAFSLLCKVLDDTFVFSGVSHLC